MQTLHRSRERLVGERMALVNQLRGILLERGIVVPQGRRKLERRPRTHFGGAKKKEKNSEPANALAARGYAGAVAGLG